MSSIWCLSVWCLLCRIVDLFNMICLQVGLMFDELHNMSMCSNNHFLR